MIVIILVGMLIGQALHDKAESNKKEKETIILEKEESKKIIKKG